MIAAFVENTRLQVLVIAMLIVAGLAALASLPRTEDPRVQNRVAVILTPFPGATAERVEALVSEPIENRLRELPEVKTIESRSQPGLSVVRIELKDRITVTEPVWSQARDKLADVQSELPAGTLPSRFDDERGYAFTRLIALRWVWPEGSARHTVDNTELAILHRYAEELQARLRSVSGTDLVDIYGAPQEEIRVILDARQASALQLSPAAIAAAIGAADAKVAAGTLRNANNRLLVEVAGELDSLESVRQIALRLTDAGDTIRVGDIARVSRELKTPATELSLVHGEPALVVAVRMLPTVRIDRWSAWIDATIADFNTTLPANVTLETLFDQQYYTTARLGGLSLNIILGFSLILLILLLTLGWRAALIVAAALPLTVLFTLACMRYWGLPIHQMSVTGLVVALGIMVDNAIVMTDAIQRKRRAGIGPLTAVLEAARHLWLPLAGSTLTTILAFAPIVLMPGPAGEFVGGIALSVMFALVGSYLISHTLIAGLAGKFLQPGYSATTRWYQGCYRDGIRLPGLTGVFQASLQLALRWPLLTVLIVSLLPLAGFIAASQLTEQFFPPSDRDMFAIELRLAPQSSLTGTRAAVEQVDTVLADYDGLTTVHWFIGSSAPSFYYNMLQNQDDVPYYAHAMVTARNFRTANRLIPELQRQLDDALPQAQILVRKLEQGPPFNAPLEIRLYGPDLDMLQTLGNEIRRVLFATEQVVHTRPTLTAGTPKIWLQTRLEQAQLSGLSLTAIAGQLQGSLDGAVQGSILEGTEELPVRVQLDASDRARLSDLASLPLATAQSDGQEQYPGIPLSALGALDIQPSWGLIPRRDGQRVNVIEGYIRTGVLPQTVLNRFKIKLAQADFTLPAGYRLEYGGESSGRNDAVGNLLSSVGIIVTLLVVVVVLSFNSFRLSGIIFLVAAQSAGLGLLSVYAFAYPFGFTVIVGLLGLSGLAINAAIVILAELKTSPEAAAGQADAIVQGVMSTTRHISSTTITTVGGFLPLILAGGGFWPPFAIAIAGGTVLTTLLSFYFVPALFRLFAQRRAFGPALQTLAELEKPASVNILPFQGIAKSV